MPASPLAEPAKHSGPAIIAGPLSLQVLALESASASLVVPGSATHNGVATTPGDQQIGARATE